MTTQLRGRVKRTSGALPDPDECGSLMALLHIEDEEGVEVVFTFQVKASVCAYALMVKPGDLVYLEWLTGFNAPKQLAHLWVAKVTKFALHRNVDRKFDGQCGKPEWYKRKFALVESSFRTAAESARDRVTTQVRLSRGQKKIRKSYRLCGDKLILEFNKPSSSQQLHAGPQGQLGLSACPKMKARSSNTRTMGLALDNRRQCNGGVRYVVEVHRQPLTIDILAILDFFVFCIFFAIFGL